MTPEIPAETVARMVALVRTMVRQDHVLDGPWIREARAILATLPEHVPADLLAAREWYSQKHPSLSKRILDGDYDLSLEGFRAGWAARDGVGE